MSWIDPILVRDLIAALGHLDPEMRVVMPLDDTADLSEASAAFVDLVAPSEIGFQLTDEREPGWERVVRLFGPEA